MRGPREGVGVCSPLGLVLMDADALVGVKTALLLLAGAGIMALAYFILMLIAAVTANP